MIANLMARFDAMPWELQLLVGAASIIGVPLLLAWLTGRRLERVSRDYGPALLNNDGSLKWPTEQQRDRAQRPLVTESMRALYGWEMETRRAGANTDDAALRHRSEDGRRNGLTNVTHQQRVIQ